MTRSWKRRGATLVTSVAAFAVVLIAAASPASAHISQFDVLNARGHAVEGGADYDTAEGTITCTAGERYLITVKVTDSPSYVGKGRTQGTCSGEQQVWTVVFSDESGVGDTSCPYQVGGRAHTKTVDGEPHGDASGSWGCF